MMDSRIHQYLLWTCIVNLMPVQAEIGDVNVGLRYQVSQCLCNSPSLYSCLTQQTLCLKSSIFQCLQFHKPRQSYHAELGTLCGVINTGRQLMSHTWHIAVHSEFRLHLEFVHFHLPATPHCASGTRVTVHTTHTIYTYCGHRMPWNMSFPQSHATVNCNTDYHIPTGFYFVMIYQAFDTDLPSVTFTRWHDYVFHHDYKDSYHYYYYLTRIYTLEYLALGQERDVKEIGIQLHITVEVFRKIYLELKSPRALIRIYDGPGILSPVIPPDPNATSVQLSSYQGLIAYSEYYGRNVPPSVYNRLDWFSKDILGLHVAGSKTHYVCNYHMYRSPGKIAHTLRGTYGVCHGAQGIFTIHQMQFIGHNRLSHSDNSQYSGCHYGGLFIIKSEQYEYFSLCSNITEEVSLPFNTENVDYKLIFITFQGYSSGFIDLTIHRDEDCYGENIAISMGPSCNNIRWIWLDQPVMYGFESPKQMCSDVWLLNNIGIASPFENCSFWLRSFWVTVPSWTF